RGRRRINRRRPGVSDTNRLRPAVTTGRRPLDDVCDRAGDRARRLAGRPRVARDDVSDRTLAERTARRHVNHARSPGEASPSDRRRGIRTGANAGPWPAAARADSSVVPVPTQAPGHDGAPYPGVTTKRGRSPFRDSGLFAFELGPCLLLD